VSYGQIKGQQNDIEWTKVVIDEVYAPDPSAYTIDTFYANYGLTSASTHAFMQKAGRAYLPSE
jgi:hypothetical protein